MYGIYITALTVGLDDNGTWKVTKVYEDTCKIKYISFSL